MRINFQTSIEYRIFLSTLRKIEASVAKIYNIHTLTKVDNELLLF